MSHSLIFRSSLAAGDQPDSAKPDGAKNADLSAQSRRRAPLPPVRKARLLSPSDAPTPAAPSSQPSHKKPLPLTTSIYQNQRPLSYRGR